MPLTNIAGLNGSLLASDKAALVVQPFQAESVAIQILGPDAVKTRAPENWEIRAPIITADPQAAWVPEGAEIPVTSPTFSEDSDVYHKIAAVTVVSNELASDITGDAKVMVTDGIMRDLATQFDKAFFGARGSETDRPRGLGDVTGVTSQEVSAWADVDPFIEATYSAASLGAPLTAFVANPTDAAALAKLKEETGSNRPLLSLPAVATPGTAEGAPVATAPKPLVGSTPLWMSQHVEPGTIWGIPSGQRVIVAIRSDVELVTSRDAYFGRDSIGLRGVMRITTLFTQPEAIQKITLAAA